MTGERQNILESSVEYGDLHMQSYDIGGNQIDAFYDDKNNLIFVLDNTITETKLNVLLVINPDGNKKWDEILSTIYNVDLELVRPKHDNKYQKLDIEYSGLNVYEDLINNYVAKKDVSELLQQLNVLREVAVKHSAMSRLESANDIIEKTNSTIVKTKDVILQLQQRLSSLNTSLIKQKKEIGKVSTKQSASKILKIESQIEATDDKLNRAIKRLNNAKRRLEVATVDAELANKVLDSNNQTQTFNIQPEQQIIYDGDDVLDEDDVMETETDTDNDIKPLFDTKPELDESSAFKPIIFDAPILSGEPTIEENITENVVQDIPPVLNQNIFNQEIENTSTLLTEDVTPILESITPVQKEPVVDNIQKPIEIYPVMNEEISENTEKQLGDNNVSAIPTVSSEELVAPSLPATNEEQIIEPIIPQNHISQPVLQQPQDKKINSKNIVSYYILLGILILLSIFTLWLYQKHITNTTPMLASKTVETKSNIQSQPETQTNNTIVDDTETESVFLDDVLNQEPAVENTVKTVVSADNNVVNTNQNTESIAEQKQIVSNDNVIATPVIEDEAVFVNEINEPNPVNVEQESFEIPEEPTVIISEDADNTQINDDMELEVLTPTNTESDIQSYNANEEIIPDYETNNVEISSTSESINQPFINEEYNTEEEVFYTE